MPVSRGAHERTMGAGRTLWGLSTTISHPRSAPLEIAQTVCSPGNSLAGIGRKESVLHARQALPSHCQSGSWMHLVAHLRGEQWTFGRFTLLLLHSFRLGCSSGLMGSFGREIGIQWQRGGSPKGHTSTSSASSVCNYEEAPVYWLLSWHTANWIPRDSRYPDLTLFADSRSAISHSRPRCRRTASRCHLSHCLFRPLAAT